MCKKIICLFFHSLRTFHFTKLQLTYKNVFLIYPFQYTLQTWGEGQCDDGVGCQTLKNLTLCFHVSSKFGYDF